MVATGGTIASAETGEGLAPQLTGEQLAGYVPQVAELADIDIVQPMNIDSTNMGPADWQRIGDAILARYEDYDGFVVLHGTDTMAYTAAALSYLIQESPRPIVLTGSQQPMASPFTDARLNLFQSVIYAADPASRDVSVVFGGKVVAGTRARKQRTMSFNAFTSVNYPELALIRRDRIIRTAPAAPVAAPATVPAETPAQAASTAPAATPAKAAPAPVTPEAPTGEVPAPSTPAGPQATPRTSPSSTTTSTSVSSFSSSRPASRPRPSRCLPPATTPSSWRPLASVAFRTPCATRSLPGWTPGARSW